MIKATIEELKRIKMVIDGVKDFIRDSKSNYFKEAEGKLSKSDVKAIERFCEYAHSEIQDASNKFEKLITENEAKKDEEGK